MRVSCMHCGTIDNFCSLIFDLTDLFETEQQKPESAQTEL